MSVAGVQSWVGRFDGLQVIRLTLFAKSSRKKSLLSWSLICASVDRVAFFSITCYLSGDVGFQLTSLFAALGVTAPGVALFYMPLLPAGVPADCLWLFRGNLPNIFLAARR